MYNKDLIYDVGMHNGDDTAYYLEKGYRVVSIEADPVQAEKGKERFAEACASGRLQILNIGVAAEPGEFDFYINEVNPEWNSFDLSIASRDGLPWHTVRIHTRRFNDIIRERGVPYYLKVDIEGHDYLCIDGLDPQQLPKFMSVEANDISLLDDLAGKGFTRFKLIYQYNLGLLQLPPDKYFNRWLFSYRLQKWDSFFIKLFRKMGGARFILWLQRKSVPPASRRFKRGCSGPFGEELAGKWLDAEKARRVFEFYHNIFNALPDKNDYGFWVDIHASW